MSFRTISDCTIAAKTFPTTTGWERPYDWPTLPLVLPTDEKFVGLHAVYDSESNFLALSATGDYTVDWGDGTSANFSSGVTAEHTYTYSDVDLSPVTSRGYKCAIVTVTPQVGQQLTSLNLHIRHSTSGLNTYSSGFLDIALASQYLTDLRIGVQTPGSSTQVIGFYDLERVNIVRSDLRQCGHLFFSCYSLQEIVDISLSTAATTSSAVTFTDAGDLVNWTAHPFRNGDAVIFSSVVTTTGITAYTRYFVVGAAANTFQISTTYGGSAVALTTDGSGVGIFGANFASIFTTCRSLQTIPTLDTSSVIDMTSAFQNCTSLVTIPLIDTSASVNFTSTFNTCTALQEIPLIDTSAGVNFGSTFQSCSSLQTVPLLNTSAGTSAASMFFACQSLQVVPALDVSSVVTTTSMFSTCPSLQTMSATGMPSTFSVASCKLGPAALDTIYTALPTVTAKTITVTGNWGVASDTPSIATAKGWTVTG